LTTSKDTQPATVSGCRLYKTDHSVNIDGATRGGRNMHFGVREHAMGAILNGLALLKVRTKMRALNDVDSIIAKPSPVQKRPSSVFPKPVSGQLA
jgi:hypothetical protein